VTRLPRFRFWLRALFRQPRLNDDLREEFEFHLSRYAADLQRQGVPPADARRRARAELGSCDARLEECRESLGLRLFDELRGDIRYTLRLLRGSPVFTVVAVLSLGLGIGANTAIFSLVDAVLLKTLPVSRPDTLFFVDDSGGASEGSNAPPYPCYETMRDRATQFSGLAMFSPERFRVAIDGVEEEIRGQYASGNYFDVLGVSAFYGRTLTSADDVRGGGPDGPAVVISHAFWKRRFGLSPTVLGKRIVVGTTPVTIVGVTPPGFFGLTVGAPVDVTVPVTQSTANLTATKSWWFSMAGRLKPGAAVESARAELDSVFQSYMTESGASPELRRYFPRIVLVPAAKGLQDIRRSLSTPLTIVMGIVGLVLVIGCANVASLLTARASGRRHEMALRLAIGAGRGRLIRQLLTEGVVLAGLGTAVGVLFARWGVALLVGLIGQTHQQIVIDASLDARTLAFAAAIAMLTGLLCSVLPALRTTGAHRLATGDGARLTFARAPGTGRSLVIIQVALSVVLLSGAGLFLRTLRNLERVDAGFQRDDVLVALVEGTAPTLTSDADPRGVIARATAAWEDLATQAASLPAARSAAVTTLTPLSGRDREVNVSVVDALPASTSEQGIHLNLVTAGTFDTLGLRLVSGRAFNRADSATGTKTAILSEAAAAAYFGQKSPVGRRIMLNSRFGPYEVVGVVRDVRYETLRETGARMAYVPMSQGGELLGKGIFNAILSIRGRGDVSALIPPLRDQVRRVVPGGFVRTMTTLDEQVEGSLLPERLMSLLASLFGVLALALACIGLYGLLAYSVIARTREFGVRMAIGAPRREVIWLVLRDTLLLVTAGLTSGVLLALWAGRYVRTLLFEVTPADPLAIGAAALILLAIALTAAYLPARRASRIDPMAALRHE
jgi:predicted permease